MYVPFFIRRINYDDGRDSDFDEPDVYKSVVRSKVGRFSPSNPTGSSNSPIMLDEDCTVRLVLLSLIIFCVCVFTA